MIKNGDDTNVLGTIATFAPSDWQGWLRAWSNRRLLSTVYEYDTTPCLGCDRYCLVGGQMVTS